MQSYERLEKEWAQWNQLDPLGMVCCASGSAALHLSLEALQLPLGSGVITSDFNMIAIARSISLAGLTPVFVDCDERLLIDKWVIPLSLRISTKALIVVHIYGRKYEMEPCGFSPGSFYFIEDLAEAHGIKPNSTTDAACWSFYKNKIVCGEEGGAVWFRDNGHAELARSLRCLGFNSLGDFKHRPRGHNYRMSNCHAELILQSLGNVGKNLVARQRIEDLYTIYCPESWRQPYRNVPWVYDLRIKGMSRIQQDTIIVALKSSGIEARHAFKPMSHQEEYRQSRCILSDPTIHNAYVASCEVIYLPIVPGVTSESQIKQSFQIIESFIKNP